MKAIFFRLFLLIGFSAWAQPGFIDVDDLNEWEDVLTLSESHRRIIYVYYISEDCDLCTEMLQSTLSRRVITDEINRNFIPVRIYASTSVGRKFAEVFELSNLPASLWMTGKEFVWKKEEGMMDEAGFRGSLDKIKTITRTYPELLKYALEDGDSLRINTWMDLLYIASVNATGNEPGLLNSLRAGLDLDSLKSKAYHPYVITYVSDLAGPEFQYIRIDHETVLGEDFPWNTYYDKLYFFNMRRAVDTRDSMLAETMELQLLPLSYELDSSDTSLDTVMQRIEHWQQYFLHTSGFKRFKDYSDSVITPLTLPKDVLMDQIDQLREYSLSESTLRLGLKWIDKSIEGEKDVELYIMKADFHIALGEYIKATEALVEAEKQEPSSSEQEAIDFLDYVIRSRY